MPLMAALQYCDEHPLYECAPSFHIHLTKEEQRIEKLKSIFSLESHEKYLNDCKENLNKSCSKYAVFHKEEKFYIPLPCNSWRCPVCGVKNADDLQKRLSSSEINSWKCITHITITVADTDVNTFIDEYFNHFYLDLQRGGTYTLKTVRGKLITKILPARPNLKYFKSKEFQGERFLKSGVWYRHFHIIVNQIIDKYSIIPIWNHVTKKDFNHVNCTFPHNINAGRYLVKYFTKPEYQDLFLPGERRYSSSRGVVPPKPVRVPSHDWEFMSIDHARNLMAAFKRDPNLNFAWKNEYDITIDSIKLHLEQLQLSTKSDNIVIAHEILT